MSSAQASVSSAMPTVCQNGVSNINTIAPAQFLAASATPATGISVTNNMAFAQTSVVSAVPTVYRTSSSDTNAQGMAPNAAGQTFVIATAATATGIGLLSLLGYWLFVLHRRKVKQHAGVQGEAEKGAASGEAAQPEMTGAIGEGLGTQPPQLTRRCPTPAPADAAVPSSPRGSSLPRAPTPASAGRVRAATPEVREAQDAQRAHRRTASSHFRDSGDRVYAAIIATPLERMRSPPIRENVGWPVPSVPVAFAPVDRPLVAVVDLPAPAPAAAAAPAPAPARDPVASRIPVASSRIPVAFRAPAVETSAAAAPAPAPEVSEATARARADALARLEGWI